MIAALKTAFRLVPATLLAVLAFGLVHHLQLVAQTTSPSSNKFPTQPDEDQEPDGLTNAQETTLRGTNPELADTDGDGKNDLIDAVGYDPAFTFKAVAESAYAVVDLGPVEAFPGSIEAVNDLGTVAVGLSGDRTRYFSFSGEDELDGRFVDLNNHDSMLVQPDNLQHPKVFSIPSASFEPVPPGWAVLLFDDFARNDSVEGTDPYGDPGIRYDEEEGSSEIVGLALTDAGEIFARYRARYSMAESDEIVPEGWPEHAGSVHWSGTLQDGEFIADGAYAWGAEGFGFVQWIPTAEPHPDPTDDVFLVIVDTPGSPVSPQAMVDQYAAAWQAKFTSETGAYGEPQPVPIARYRHFNHAGDYVIEQSQATYPSDILDGVSFASNTTDLSFTDGTEVFAGEVAALDASLKQIARLQGESGPRKVWRSRDSEGAWFDGLSAAGPGTALPLKDGGEDADTIPIKEIAENGLARTGSALWRNGRILTEEEILGRDSPWTHPLIAALSDNGTFVAATVTNQETGKQHYALLLKVDFETFPDDETREIGGSRSPNWKAHKLNLDTKQGEETHYGDYAKCVAHIWNDQPLNLAKYLSDYESNQEVFENPDVLNWNVNGQLQTSYELNLETSAPNENQYERYNIEVLTPGSSEPIDRLIVTVVPPETLTTFDQWVADNQDLGWLAELPALYSTVLLDVNLEAMNPEPSNLACNNWKDNKPFSMFFDMGANTYYHPDADYEIRSEETPAGHGHQACYNEAGVLIRSGVSAGTADRAFYGNTSSEDGHVGLDAIPFVWAVQLDGTPAQGEDGIFPDYSSMDNPIMHEGQFIGEYIDLRPPIANDRAELIPGNCP